MVGIFLTSIITVSYIKRPFLSKGIKGEIQQLNPSTQLSREGTGAKIRIGKRPSPQITQMSQIRRKLSLLFRNMKSNFSAFSAISAVGHLA